MRDSRRGDEPDRIDKAIQDELGSRSSDRRAGSILAIPALAMSPSLVRGYSRIAVFASIQGQPEETMPSLV